MKLLVKYFKLYFRISLVLAILAIIIIVISTPMFFREYTAYPIFKQKPYSLVILQFIVQTTSSLKVVFGTLTVSLIGLFIAVHFRKLYGKLREMV